MLPTWAIICLALLGVFLLIMIIAAIFISKKTSSETYDSSRGRRDAKTYYAGPYGFISADKRPMQSNQQNNPTNPASGMQGWQNARYFF